MVVRVQALESRGSDQESYIFLTVKVCFLLDMVIVCLQVVFNLPNAVNL